MQCKLGWASTKTSTQTTKFHTTVLLHSRNFRCSYKLMEFQWKNQTPQQLTTPVELSINGFFEIWNSTYMTHRKMSDKCQILTFLVYRHTTCQFVASRNNWFLCQAGKETAGGGLTKNWCSYKNSRLAASYRANRRHMAAAEGSRED